MKKYIFLFLALFVFQNTFAQKITSVNVTWTTGAEHDYGDQLKVDKTYSFDFKFVNKSDAPILIENVRTECGCTVPTWSDEFIKPNEESTIHVEFDAEKKEMFRKKITVWFDHVKKPEVLWIEGEVQ